MTTLRANLKEWLSRARAGEEIVITERGLPIARLSPIDETSRIEALTAAGILAPAKRPKGKAYRKGIKLRGEGTVLDLIERR
ncbi:MAG: hypothetical protein JWN67_1088 [Actinomycetia bacterium]|nr:hypothetical protein [Actinomycetes bacterium]